MDEFLRSMNVTLSQIAHELRTTHALELQAAHKITPDCNALPKRSKELESTMQHLEDIQNLLTPPLYKVTDGIFAFTTSAALQTVVQYRIPDILVSSPDPISTRAMAQQAGVSVHAIEPLLHLLANSPGVLELVEATTSESREGTANDDGADLWCGNATTQLLTRDHWTQWWRWVDLYTAHFPEIVGRLPAAAAVNERRTAMHLTYSAEEQTPLYQVLAKQVWASKFHTVLGAGAVAMAPGMLADYPWDEIGDAVICDLGGGAGDFLVTLLRQFSRLRGALLEIDSTAALAAKRVGEAEAGVRDRVVEIHTGDFFIEVPAYSVYIIKWTLHNWDNAQTEKILRNVREAMTPSAVNRLLIIDSVIMPGDWRSRPALYGGIVMSAGSKGGKERTETEWRRLASNAGWRVVQVYSPRGCIPCILDLR